MESHIKFIGNMHPGVRCGVISSIDDVFRKLSDEDKLRYMLQQALLISYYSWLYDVRSDEFMYRYALSLREYIHKTRLDLDGVYAILRVVLDNLVESWFSNAWKDVPIKLLMGCVADTANSKYPYIAIQPYDRTYPPTVEEFEREKNTIRSIFIPYLMFRNHQVEDGYEVWNGAVKIPKFELHLFSSNNDHTVNPNVGHYSLWAMGIGHGFFAKFSKKVRTVRPGIDADYFTPLYAQLPQFLQFYCCCSMFDSANPYFDGVIRTLACMNLSMDEFSKFTINSILFYDSHVVLNDMYDIDFATSGLNSTGCDPERNRRFIDRNFYGCTNVCRDLIKTFRIMCELDGVKFSSHALFDRFFSSLNAHRPSEISRILEYCKRYLVKEGPTPASEALAYKASYLGGLEAIQLFSQYDSGQTESSEEQEEPETTGDEVDLDIDENFEEGVAEPGLEADENDDPPESDEDTGDSSTDGDQDADDSSPDSKDDNPDDPAVEEDNSSQDSGDSNNDPSVTQTAGAPEEIDASDTDGVPFEISPEGSETVDSVMLREEIDQFITNILANPPKELSPQSVAALTTLQKCWVHLLTVETVVRILDRLVTIPEKFKNIITQMELKQDE